MVRRHIISFKHAFSGLKYAFISQPNFVIHTIFSCLAIFLSLVLEINYLEWVVVAVSITTGLVIELINTAIESVVDLVTLEKNQHAKHAKDTAAAAMLIYAFGAVIIATIIFVPKFLKLL